MQPRSRCSSVSLLIAGELYKYTLNDGFTSVVNTVKASVAPGRFILGVACDPRDINPDPAVYFSNSKGFHRESRNSFGNAIDGKISKASGPNLNTVENVVRAALPKRNVFT